MWLIWLSFFILSTEIPLTRSLVNALSTGFLTAIGIFYSPFAYISAEWTSWYYLYDIFDIVYRDKYKFHRNIFLYHHIMALVCMWSTLYYDDIEYIKWSAVLGLLFEFTTVFMNWMKMVQDPQRYLGWYPNISPEYITQGFAFSFLSCRIAIGVPLSLWMSLKAPYICQFCIGAANSLNIYWAYRLIRYIFKKKLY